MIHWAVPYRSDKNLGRAYNDEFKKALAFKPCYQDHVCLRDIDTMFLTPEAPAIVEHYAESYPDALLTCFTNRIGNKAQRLSKDSDENRDMGYHIEKAINRQKSRGDFLPVTELKAPISGMFMIVPIGMWIGIGGFKEGIGCLGVDTDFSQRVQDANYKILLMTSIYIWHTYRLMNGVQHKKHLI